MQISRSGYYSNVDILFEIIKQHNRRETFFLPYNIETRKSSQPIRWLLANYIGMMKRHWKEFGFLYKPMNLYHSLATYQNFPCFSYNQRFKSAQQMLWMKKYHEYVVDVDCFIETDSPDLKLSIGDAIDIKKFFDKYKIKYSIKMSGSKGAHLLIPAEEFNWLGMKPYDKDEEEKVRDFNKIMASLPIKNGEGNGIKIDKVMLYKILSMRLSTLLSCSTIDTAVQDVKRVIKSAYSWDVKSNRIALPLTDNQLYNFNTDIVEPISVLKAGVYKRGLLWRNTDINPAERNRLMNNMLVDLGIL